MASHLVRDRSAKELKRVKYINMDAMPVRRIAFACLGFGLILVLSNVDALAAQAPSPIAPANSLCTMTVQVPPAAGRGQARPAGPGGAGRGGERGGAAQPPGLPKLCDLVERSLR